MSKPRLFCRNCDTRFLTIYDYELVPNYCSCGARLSRIVPDDIGAVYRDHKFQPLTTWKAPRCPIEILPDVLKIISQAFDACQRLMPNNPVYFKYTAIDFAIGDPRRLSGIALNKVQAQFKPEFFTRQSHIEKAYVEKVLNLNAEEEYRFKEGTYITPAKLIRAIDPDLSDDEISCIASKLADLLKARVGYDPYIVQVSDTPSEIYTMYSSFKSCMISKPASFFELYDMYAKILYIREGSTLVARALLWDDVDCDGTKINYMDRIYGDYEAQFRSWASKNGYHYRLGNSLVVPGGECIRYDTLKKQLEPFLKLNNVPYMDTFSYYYPDSGVISDDCDLPGRSTTLDSQEGRDDDGLIADCLVCACCSSVVDRDYANTDPSGDTVCDECYHEHVGRCEQCDDDYWRSNLTWLDNYQMDVCDHCLRNDFTRCKECNEFTKDDDLKDGLCESCYDDLPTCDNCGVKSNSLVSVEFANDYKDLCEGCNRLTRTCSKCENEYIEECNCE